ncbi:MAG: putative DNA binding domain-containing protein, partial [Muribaculaceae bacterium]|nr:putative DNA binding domain-containing protein [Muribaculaceae bacterium]
MNLSRSYIEELNALDEHVRIEAKQCSDKIDKSVLETICAFSNEPELGGGTIIIGLQESENPSIHYDVIGVKDADKLQKDLASQCATMFNHPIRPLIESDMVDGKTVIVVKVAELDNKLKPLYFSKEGLPRGVWRRIGSTDQRCTEEDLSLFYYNADEFDKAIAEDTDIDDIDENAVRRYRQLRKEVNPVAEELNYSDHDLLRALKAISKDRNGIWRLTNTGLLVFGKQMALRREMPSVRVDYIRVPGTEWVSDPHNRFESIDMRGPMLLLVSRAFNAIVDDLPRGFSLKPGSLQANRPLSVPEDALREAIVNALVHQSLRVHRPIQIIRYSNRIEIVNPGFSLKPVEALGEPGSEMRNPTIASIFHETQLAEAKGTGIGTMRRLMKEASMMPPTFESDHTRNTFTIRILLHHFLSEEDLKWFKIVDIDEYNEAQKVALIFLREVGAIDNITFRQLSGVSTKDATRDLRILMKAGLIESRGQGRHTYYIPAEKLKELYARKEFKGVSLESKGVSLES